MTLDISLWITVLNAVMKLGGLLKRWWRRICRGRRNIPSTAVAVVPAGPLGWSNGPTKIDQPTMVVLGFFYFTNASARPLTILNARLTAFYWKARFLPAWKRIEGNVTLSNRIRPPINPLLTRRVDQRDDDISPGKRASGQAVWIIEPAIRRPGAILWGSACFTDSYNNEHSTGLLTWPYRSSEGTR